MNNILDIITTISKYGLIWMPLIIVYSFIRIYKYKEEPETNLILKMIGFYIIGSFSFSLNGFTSFPIVIPIGYITYCFVIKDKERVNEIVKHKCAILGITMLAVSYVNGFIYNKLEYRDYVIRDYSADRNKLYEEWENIEEKLKLEGDSLLSEFRMEYNTKNKIERLNFTFRNINEIDKSYNVISSTHGRLDIYTSKNEPEYMYGFDTYSSDYHQANADEFMKILSNIEFEKSQSEHGKEIVAYNVQYLANESSTNSYSNPTYVIDSGTNDYKDIEYRKAKLREVPLTGTIILHAPMEKVSEGRRSSTSVEHYVLNGYSDKMLIKEDTESLLVENIKEHKSIKYSDYDYKIVDIANILETYNWEETKMEDVDERPYIRLSDNNEIVVTLYENNYAIYEDNEERVVYNIPEVTIDNVLGIINNDL